MIIRCNRCLIPQTRPDTAFEGGTCSACIAHDRRQQIEWDDREGMLLQLLDKFHGEVLVPSSGGKDSTYQAMTLKRLGANVTCVTATTCHLTPIGRRNIDNLARHCTTIEVTPNRSVRAKLNRLGMNLVGDISWPEHVAIFSIPWRMAVDLNKPLIMYGESPQAQYGGPPGTQEAREMTLRWRSEFGGFLGMRPTDMVGQDGITERDMRDYAVPSAEDLEVMGVEAHFLGQYIGPWNSHQNADLAIANGFQCELPTLANRWTTENQDNHQTGAHDFFGYLKYGYGRGAAQISVDIREGLIEREEALAWATEYDGLFPLMYMGLSLDEILSHISVTRDQCLACCNSFMNPHLFVQDHVEWGTKLILKE